MARGSFEFDIYVCCFAFGQSHSRLTLTLSRPPEYLDPRHAPAREREGCGEDLLQAECTIPASAVGSSGWSLS